MRSSEGQPQERLMRYGEFLRLPVDTESAEKLLTQEREGKFHCFGEGQTRSDYKYGIVRYWDFFRTDEEASPYKPAKTRYRVYANGEIEQLLTNGQFSVE